MNRFLLAAHNRKAIENCLVVAALLLTGFAEGTEASERWKQLSTRKLKELAAKAAEIEFMQGLLREMMDTCHCDTRETCGKGIFHQIGGVGGQGVSNCCTPKA